MANLNKSLDDVAVLIDSLRNDNGFDISEKDLSEVIVNASELLVSAVYKMSLTDKDDFALLLIEAVNIGASLSEINFQLSNETQSIH